MQTWIALLRGVNVGGRNLLPMKTLAKDLEAEGLSPVQTYIQSGNVVFGSDIARGDDIAALITQLIDDRHGFRPQVLVISAVDLRHAKETNPFNEAESEPSTLHLFFCSAMPSRSAKSKLELLAAETERFQIKKKVLYLPAPKGIARSKLASGAEKALGVPTTARNWRTVSKLVEMSQK